MADVRKIHVVYICNFVSSKCWQIVFLLSKLAVWCITVSSVWNIYWRDVRKLIFLRQSSCCSMFGVGWVWVGLGHRSISSPGLGWICMAVGWVWSWDMKMDPWTTLLCPQARTLLSSPTLTTVTHCTIYCCAWPAEGHSVLNIEQSWFVIWAAPTDWPMSFSTCCSRVLRGRPGGRFQLAVGEVPTWASIDSCSVCNCTTVFLI